MPGPLPAAPCEVRGPRCCIADQCLRDLAAQCPETIQENGSWRSWHLLETDSLAIYLKVFWKVSYQED